MSSGGLSIILSNRELQLVKRSLQELHVAVITKSPKMGDEIAKLHARLTMEAQQRGFPRDEPDEQQK